MPIRDENKDRYPDNWPEIRAQVQARAGDKCEGCGLVNGAVGVRDDHGHFHYLVPRGCTLKRFTVVCTTAHLDHDPTNNNLDNLRFWCQQCHNRYDAPERARGIKERRRAAVRDAGQGDML